MSDDVQRLLAMTEWPDDACRAFSEERAARLKAEAERDALREAHNLKRAVDDGRGLTAEVALDEALALLSKAREAWARYTADRPNPRDYQNHAEWDAPRRTARADLAKILGTGETT